MVTKTDMSNIASTRKLALQLTVTISVILLAIVAKSTVAAELGNSSVTSSISADRASELTHMLRHDCGSCHGMTLKGGLGPSLLPEQFQDKNIEYIKLTILHGRSGTAMPPWKSIISDADAQWIAEFLFSGKINQLNQ